MIKYSILFSVVFVVKSFWCIHFTCFQNVPWNITPDAKNSTTTWTQSKYQIVFDENMPQ